MATDKSAKKPKAPAKPPKGKQEAEGGTVPIKPDPGIRATIVHGPPKPHR